MAATHPPEASAFEFKGVGEWQLASSEKALADHWLSSNLLRFLPAAKNSTYMPDGN